MNEILRKQVKMAKEAMKGKGYLIYEDKILGLGGRGTVFRAYSSEKKQDVAIKIYENHSEDDVKRMSREIKNLKAAKGHENIVGFHEDGTCQINSFTVPYVVLDYVSGGPLTYYIKNDILSIQQGLAIFHGLLKGLEYLHTYSLEKPQKIFHRDIKPQNILVEMTKGGIYKGLITDFDSSRSNVDSKVTAPGAVPPATVGYMGIEYTGKNPVLDHRTDIYAMGLTMYNFFSKKVLLPPNTQIKTSKNGSTVVSKPSYFFNLFRMFNEKEAFKSLHEENPLIPKDISEVCMRAIQIDPEERYQKTSEFVKAFDALVKKYPIQNKYNTPSGITATDQGRIISIVEKELGTVLKKPSQQSDFKNIGSYELSSEAIYNITHDKRLILVDNKGLEIINLKDHSKNYKINYNFNEQKPLGVIQIPQQQEPYYLVASRFGGIDTTSFFMFKKDYEGFANMFEIRFNINPSLYNNSSFFVYGNNVHMCDNKNIYYLDLIKKKFHRKAIGSSANGRKLCLYSHSKLRVYFGIYEQDNILKIGTIDTEDGQMRKIGNVEEKFNSLAYSPVGNILYLLLDNEIKTYQVLRDPQAAKQGKKNLHEFSSIYTGDTYEKLIPVGSRIIATKKDKTMHVYEFNDKSKLEYQGCFNHDKPGNIESIDAVHYSNYLTFTTREEDSNGLKRKIHLYELA